jgi:hypothetical protein
VFRWIACDRKGDADFVGARNILTKTLAAIGAHCPGARKCPHINKMFPDSLHTLLARAVRWCFPDFAGVLQFCKFGNIAMFFPSAATIPCRGAIITTIASGKSVSVRGGRCNVMPI